MSKIKSLRILVGVLATLAMVTATAQAAGRKRLVSRGSKYVFFFLGDGMASVQMQATEAYLATMDGGSHDSPKDLMGAQLNMNRFPVQGMATTFADGRFITGSAAAGTAFASGTKTSIGTIGMSSDHTRTFKSLGNLAAETGKKVGVISSVSIDHATPAAYYANVPSRSRYNEIEYQMANSGFNFFGGGGLKRPTGDSYTSYDIMAELAANGYSVLDSTSAIRNLLGSPQDKVVCINAWLQNSGAMPYEMDHEYAASDDLTLAEFVEVGIACLQDDPDGFFMTVEGGKIDWACHANDAKAAIVDTVGFDNAIGVALDFYYQHPRDTLIVVTGDHECGGMTCGFSASGYASAYEILKDQTVSYQYFNDEIWSDYKAANGAGFNPETDDIQNEPDGEFQGIMFDYFGIVWADLDDFDKERFEAAYDKSMAGVSENTPEEDNQLYGYYEPITVTLTHVLNEKAGIGWTSYSHTGVPVPVLAIGRQAWRFDGFYDNTDIAKRLARAMGVRHRLPVDK